MKRSIIILSVILLCSCADHREVETNSESAAIGNVVTLGESQIRNAGIVTGKVGQQSITSVLKVSGRIEVPPQNKVSVSVPYGGYLKGTKLLPGMQVKKGEAIAVLEDPQYIQLQQEYLTGKSKLTFAETEYIRQKELNQSKAVSDKTFQMAEAEYAVQKVLVKSLAEKLKLIGINPAELSESTLSRSISVHSPADGYVSVVNSNIGRYTAPGTVLFEIVDPRDAHLVLDVFEKDAGKLAAGQQVLAYSNYDPAKRHACEIFQIAQGFSENRSVEAHCHFKSPDKSLIPGMYLNAEIETKRNNAYVLPAEAIVSDGNKTFIFVKKGASTFEMMAVQTGITENGLTEIIGGEALNNFEIVTKEAYWLLMTLKNK